MRGLFFMLFRDGATLGRVTAMAMVMEMGMERYFALFFHQCLILKLFLLPGVRASWSDEDFVVSSDDESIWMQWLFCIYGTHSISSVIRRNVCNSSVACSCPYGIIFGTFLLTRSVSQEMQHDATQEMVRKARAYIQGLDWGVKKNGYLEVLSI